MKYFKPEILDRLNSGEPRVMTRAMAAWDRNAARYAQRLQTIRSHLSAGAKRLAAGSCFHDTQVWSLSFADERRFSVILREGILVHTLTFELIGQPIISRPRRTPKFASEGTLWMYEEVDVARNHLILRVLFSDGDELTIPFSDVSVESYELRPSEAVAGSTTSDRAAKRSARSPANLDRLTMARHYESNNVGSAKFGIVVKTHPKPARQMKTPSTAARKS